MVLDTFARFLDYQRIYRYSAKIVRRPMGVNMKCKNWHSDPFGGLNCDTFVQNDIGLLSQNSDGLALGVTDQHSTLQFLAPSTPQYTITVQMLVVCKMGVLALLGSSSDFFRRWGMKIQAVCCLNFGHAGARFRKVGYRNLGSILPKFRTCQCQIWEEDPKSTKTCLTIANNVHMYKS